MPSFLRPIRRRIRRCMFIRPISNFVRRRCRASQLPAEKCKRARPESESSDSSFSSLGSDIREAKEREPTCSCSLLDWLFDMAEKSSGISRSFLLLYCGYGISCIGDRLWTFAIVFILERLGGMRLVSINQFIEAISAMLLSTYIGNWMDRRDRRHGTLTVLAFNNISVALSASMLLICLSSYGSTSCLLYFTCITLSIFFCALSKCASEAEKFSFTKDWIVVLTKKEDQSQLSARNATMTVIDQLSSVIAPIVTGYSLTCMGYKGACLFFVACNLFFWVVERTLLAKVYNEVDELHVRERVRDDESVEREIEFLTHTDRLPVHKRLCKMIRAYWRQSVCPAAFGLAMLYMTVLGFDGLAISHAKSQNLPDDVIGWFRSAGSVLGIAGAFTYTVSERIVGVRKTGVVGLILQQTFLWLCVISIALPGSPFDPEGYRKEITLEKWWEQFVDAFAANPPDSPIQKIGDNITMIPTLPSLHTSADVDWSALTIHGYPLFSVLVFLSGLTLARLGLWMADLCITQLMQENIPEEERGTVFGVQNAFCQLFNVLKDIIVIVFPDPRTFGFLIIMSVFFVTLGFATYCVYLIKTRKHCQKGNLSLKGAPIQEMTPLKPVESD
ncbi:unnamed protein product [Bursaphelenchus xylophilus]|uniref:Solute carrier family 40 member n=1 Tax=Bursaphelenchus xylophilus TaxID=6326 RepID=A0A1I7SLG8_BURXY|nr:unnamed protein product [Bursaphelenchus xylophilus]CAG9129585.1 unnamed protein product [Bursaphelenchus xylophilus]